MREAKPCTLVARQAAPAHGATVFIQQSVKNASTLNQPTTRDYREFLLFVESKVPDNFGFFEVSTALTLLLTSFLGSTRGFVSDFIIVDCFALTAGETAGLVGTFPTLASPALALGTDLVAGLTAGVLATEVFPADDPSNFEATPLDFFTSAGATIGYFSNACVNTESLKVFPGRK
ncbi:MAG: hypothetical protein QM520_05135 [Gammaproteobacteria bacterium]|nr:hypothetical protein [Gammaproteobacteria bacterium]